MVNNNNFYDKYFDIFFRCIFLFSILLLVSIFVKAYIAKKNKKDKKEAFFNYKTGVACRNTNSGGKVNWGYGLRAFHIGAAGPANNDGKQIMSWDHNRIKNECKKIAESRFGKTGYSGISVHHTGPWFTRGCDIYHKQTKPIETIPYSGKNCYINPDFVPLVPEIKGCTNPEADNYNPNANKENYSCIITGCTDPEANNFNPNANTNDNSCILPSPVLPPLNTEPEVIELKKDEQCNTDIINDITKCYGCDKNPPTQSCSKVPEDRCISGRYVCEPGTVNNGKDCPIENRIYCKWHADECITDCIGGTNNNNCTINFDKGFCVSSNNIAEEEGKHKIDNVDVGLESIDRSIECYNKAKQQYGSSLSAIEIVSGIGDGAAGCYAHTSPTILKGSNNNNAICHVIGKNSISDPQLCNLSVINENSECSVLITRKQELKKEYEDVYSTIVQNNNQLQNLITNKSDKNLTQLENIYGKNKSEMDNLKTEKLQLLSNVRDAEIKQIESAISCSAEDTIILMDLINDIFTLNSSIIAQQIQNSNLRQIANKLEIISLEENAIIRAEQHMQKLQEQQEAHNKQYEETKRLLNEKLQKDKDEALAKEEERIRLYKEYQTKLLEEQAKIEEETRQKEAEIAKREVLLQEERLNALIEAEKLAQSNEQKNALNYAINSATNKLKNLQNELNEMNKNHASARLELQTEFAKIDYKVKACNDNIQQVRGAKDKTSADLEKCGLFTRQMQRIEPVFF